MIALAASLVAAALLAGARAGVATPTIDVVFGAQGAITVTYNGAPLGSGSPPGTVIPAGGYNVVVDNTLGEVGITFTLTGPGVSVDTDVDGGESATETWPVTLAPNATYTYENTNLPGSSQAFSTSSLSTSSPGTSSIATPGTGQGSQATGTTPAGGGSGAETNGAGPSHAATTPAAAPAAPPLRGTLVAVVAADGALSFRDGGRAVASLLAGRYTITVTDHSRSSGFTIQQLRAPAITITGAGFLGARTTTVTLAAGQWVYYPSFLGRKTYFIVLH